MTAGHWPKFQHGALTLYTWPIKFMKNRKKWPTISNFLFIGPEITIVHNSTDFFY